MKYLYQIRFWSAVSIVIVGGCESLALLTSKTLSSVYHPIPGEAAARYQPNLRSSSPVYFQDGMVAETSQQLDTTNPALKYAPPVTEDDPNTLSMPLIQYICANQAMLLLIASSVTMAASFFGDSPMEMLSLHWNGGQAFHSLFDWQPSSVRAMEGILASLPLIGVGQLIERSDNTDASRFNFATTNMVISLFGRRESELDLAAAKSSQVMGLSALIGISSGISEEMIFRGYIPAAIAALTHSPLMALFGQAALFAVGHLSKDAQPGENKMNVSFQFLIGLWYGTVYLAAGGDILPCILAHALYDMHTLCETWMQVNNQMDYTQESSMKRIEEEESLAVRRLQSETGAKLNKETVSFARHFFYAFDTDHVGRLSLSDCQRAVSYAFMNDSITPSPKVVKDLFRQTTEQRSDGTKWEDRLDFSEFLHILFVLRTNSR